MKRIDSNPENQIMGMHSKIKGMLREVNQEYPESYVRTATREVEENLNKIYILSESISKGLRRAFTWRASRIGQSPILNFDALKAHEASVFKVSGTATLMGMLKNLWNKAHEALLIKKLAPFQEDKQISSLINNYSQVRSINKK